MTESGASPSGPTAAEEQAAALLAEHIRAVTGLSVGLDVSFFAAGLNSATLVAVHTRLAGQFPRLLIAEMFKYPTRRSLARFLAGRAGPTRATGATGATAATGPVGSRPDSSAAADSPEARRALRARIRQRDS